MRSLAALVMLSTLLSGCLGGGGDAEPERLDAVSGGVSAVLYGTVLRDELSVPAADGTPLRVSVWRPETEAPVPVILVQSPYWSFLGDAKAGDRPTWYIDYFVPRGYAVALGEMRGTRDSGGCWDFGGELDQRDGHDVVEALAAMPWSNGNVGMLGQSHVGMSQVAAAVTAPPSLKAIVPIAAVTDWYRYLHFDGAPYVLNRATPPAYLAVHASPSDPPTGGDAATADWVLTQAQTACTDNAVHVSQSAELDGDKDAYWQERDLIARAGDTRAAVFLVHGFLDENVKTDHFLDYWQALPDDVPKKAWYGQWYHEHPAYLEWREEVHRWYDHFLKGIENGVLDEPRVLVQDNLGHNRTEADWPPAGVRLQRHELGPDGLLPPRSEPSGSGLRSLYSVPGDDRGVAPALPSGDRPFLAFPGAPLEVDLRISGAPTLEFIGRLSAPHGRWAAALFDVAPDGTRDEVTRGYLDAGHADGLESGSLVTPLQDREYVLRMYPRDHVVRAGHGLEVVFFGGDMGCVVPGTGPYAGTCEGTGILPAAEPGGQSIRVGEGQSHLVLPVATVDGPERGLTELEDWLDALPE